MDAVLGLSMTPTSVGLVLVEGQEADGATMDGDTFAIVDGIVDGAVPGSDQAAAAVLRTEEIAATRGLRLHSIGVTWSEDADAEASKLMQSLSDSGFDNVVAIRMPEATEALARGVADVLGYATTAVCVIEPDSVISLIVNTSDGAVQTAFNHGIDSDDALVSWLSTVFTRADWAPEALVVVGSEGGFESIMQQLEDVLSVPVFAPEEAKLALARGAALASAQNTDPLPHLFDGVAGDQFGRHWVAGSAPTLRRSSMAAPAALLAAAVLTFVVSVSIAIGLQLSPSRVIPPSADPAARAEPPAAVTPLVPVVATPADVVPAPVVEEAPPPPETPPPVYEEPPAPVTDTPAEVSTTDQPALPPTDDAPVVDPAVPAPAADAPAVAGTAPPVYQAPPVPAVPTKKPGILTRIRERLTPGNDN